MLTFSRTQVVILSVGILYLIMGFVLMLKKDIGIPIKHECEIPKKDVKNSATGSIFSGNRVRKFDLDVLFDSEKSIHKQNQNIESLQIKVCEKWNVVTTIFNVTKSVSKAASLKDWCTVIIGDNKTPTNYISQNIDLANNKNVFFISAQEQYQNSKVREDAINRYIRSIPFDHFSRKNVGFLYAIQHGAKIIFDFDDDNELGNDIVDDIKNIIPWKDKTHWKTNVVSTSESMINPYLILKPTLNNTWPRGFPLESINLHSDLKIESNVSNFPVSEIGVVQILANHDPDVDAVYRLTRKLPIYFDENIDNSLVLPLNVYAPYNAQATLHMHSAIWATVLPMTVPGRVSDIWRAYFSQCIFAIIGIHISFVAPVVTQIRNVHNYLADMEAETDLYFKTGKLISFLSTWKTDAKTVPGAIEELWIDLYERTYIELQDVLALQLWLQAIQQTSYVFPILNKKSEDSSYTKQADMQNILLIGQFNYATPGNMIREWVQSWSYYFPFQNIVVNLPVKHIGYDVVESLLYLIGIYKDDTLQKKNQLDTSSVYLYKYDAGYYSPMSNFINTMKNHSHVEGALYVHDDMIVSHLLMSNIKNNKKTWTLSGIGSDSEDLIGNVSPYRNKTINTFRWFRNGTYSIDVPLHWNNFVSCKKSFSSIMQDSRMEYFWQPDGGLSGGWGQSDMLYASNHNKTQMKIFLTLLTIFDSHKLHLECGIPTALSILVENYGIKYTIAPLCTDWTVNRLDTSKWKCISDKGFQLLHPIKMSKSISDWKHKFDSFAKKLKHKRV